MQGIGEPAHHLQVLNWNSFPSLWMMVQFSFPSHFLKKSVNILSCQTWHLVINHYRKEAINYSSLAAATQLFPSITKYLLASPILGVTNRYWSLMNPWVWSDSIATFKLYLVLGRTKSVSSRSSTGSTMFSAWYFFLEIVNPFNGLGAGVKNSFSTTFPSFALW